MNSDIEKLINMTQKNDLEKMNYFGGLAITGYSTFPNLFKKEDIPLSVYMLSHYASQQMFLIDNLLDGHQEISVSLIQLEYLLPKLIGRYIYQIGKTYRSSETIEKKYMSLFSQTMNCLIEEQNYQDGSLHCRKNPSTSLIRDSEYRMISLNKVSLWKIIPWILFSDYPSQFTENVLHVMDEMAIINQLIDDITDWESDLQSSKWSYFSFYLAEIFDINNPQQLILSCKNDYQFVNCLHDIAQEIKESSREIIKELDTLELFKLKSWWTNNRLPLVDKILAIR